MTMTEQRLKTLALCPQDYRLREPLDVLGEAGLLKLAGADTGNAVAAVALDGAETRPGHRCMPLDKSSPL
jgi:hypothetical protein